MTAISNALLVVCFIGVVVTLAGASYPVAMRILSHPLVAILMLLFLMSGLIHMRLGMQIVIEDYIHAELPKLAALVANTFFAIVIGVSCAFALFKISFGG
jgi:succinate dehydrogenase / fumarate reductase membrane anchor subunit